MRPWVVALIGALVFTGLGVADAYIAFAEPTRDNVLTSLALLSVAVVLIWQLRRLWSMRDTNNDDAGG